MTNTAMIRPAWTPVTIALMVLGFIIAWPLGLAMLAYIIWGDRLDDLKHNMSCAKDRFSENFNQSRSRSYTSNVAFDEWREEELARLKEKRRELDEMYSEFEAYQRDLRRAKDQEEFDAFMKSRKRKSPPRRKKNRGDVIET